MLRSEIEDVLRAAFAPKFLASVSRLDVLASLPRSKHRDHALVFLGVRRAGKSTLQLEVMRKTKANLYCNFEDTRLYGFGPGDFGSFIEVLENLPQKPRNIFLDEVQEVAEWQRLVRALLDKGFHVCVTGSNASLLGKELGSKLTGRHLSREIFPFSFHEFLVFEKKKASVQTFTDYLAHGGFPGYLRERDPQVLQELLRDIVLRDVAARYALRETRHLMNLVLFLFANTGQAISMQKLTKSLAIPTVGQTSAYLEYLRDAYLLLPVPKWSAAIKQRIITPNKYYAIDNGMRMASAIRAGDLGHRLENAVLLALRRAGESVTYASEKDAWECDFVTERELIQVCTELTRETYAREVRGLVQASKQICGRNALILTLNQTDTFEDSGLSITVMPAWKWELQRPNTLHTL
jgi:uncharacterized protein